MSLLDAWASWQPREPPFILDGDVEVLDSERSVRARISHGSWRQAYGAGDFAAPGDTRLHLGLLPFPFCGDVRSATIYLLLLNPGLGPHDYYGEHEVPEYRKALVENLQQTFRRDRAPFLFLDPQYSWHGGFGWWHGKLAGVAFTLVNGSFGVKWNNGAITTSIKSNILNKTVQQHVFGDLLRRSVTGELRFDF